MPRNGSGTFIPTPSSVYPAVANTVIDPVAFNTLEQDFSSGLTQSLSKDGQTVPTANLPMGSFKHTGVANGSAVTDYAAVGQVQGGTLILLADTAGTNTVTTTATPTLTAYVKGQTFRAKLGGTCSGAVTLNIDSLGAKAVQKNQNALGSGDWTSGDFTEFVYDGTQFQLLSPARTPFIPSNSLPLSIITQQTANTVVVNNTNATANLTVASISASQVLGRTSSSDLKGLTFTEMLDNVGSAAWGDILFRGTASWQKLAAGTSGLFLKSNGPGADPSYATPATITKFTSGSLAYPTAGTPVATAHGLGAAPFGVQIELINVTTEGSYVTGDKIVMNPGVSDQAGVGFGFAVYYDATNVTFNMNNQLFIIPKTGTGSVFQPTAAKWNVIVKAWV